MINQGKKSKNFPPAIMDLLIATEFGRIFAVTTRQLNGQKYSFSARNVLIFDTRVHQYTM